MYILPSLQPSFRDQIKNECALRSKGTGSTIFGTAFSPRVVCSDTLRTCQHLVACTSDGMLLIWDLSPSSQKSTRSNNSKEVSVEGNLKPFMKKRKMAEQGFSSHRQLNEDAHAPVEVNVCRGVLYDVQFIQDHGNDDDGSSQALLLTCGDEGVFIFQWNDVLSQIKTNNSSAAANRNYHHIPPKSHLKPYPNSFSPMTPTEINQLSYDASSKRLYGAAGDSFGGYIWDIQTSQIVGNLGIGQGSCHTDYLLSIQSIHDCQPSGSHLVLTGGADGKVGIWSGKDQKLIESIDCNNFLGKGSTSASASSSIPMNSNSSNQSLSTWVSSMDVHPECNWAIIGGGVDSTNAYTSSVKHGGFAATLHLPTRTVSTYKETTETINNVAYHSKGTGIVTVGNDCAVSFWDSMDVSRGRTSRSWLSSPASYSIGIYPDNDMMVVAGVGCMVDCFSPYMTKTNTLRRRI